MSSYLLRRIHKSLDALVRAQYFSAIDLTSAYNQVQVRQDTRLRSHPNGPTWVQLDVVRVKQSDCHLPEADADNVLWRPVVCSFGVLGQLRFCRNSIADHLAWASLSEDEGPWVQYTRREVSVIPKLRQVPWLCGVIWGRGNWPSKHRSSSAFPRCSDGLVGVGIVLSTVHSRLSVDSTTTPSAGHQNPRRGKQQETRHWEGNLRVSLPQLSV